MFEDGYRVQVLGHIRIWEKESGKVLFDDHNAVHYENMSVGIAQSLAGDLNGSIYSLAFGNGGARATSTNKFIYSTLQTLGRSATLYNQTYEKIVGAGNDPDNNITVSHISGNLFSDILVSATLGINEPSDQESTNTVTGNGDMISSYTFSEIGLKTKDGYLLTHRCFYPILKASNIALQLAYMLRIQIV